MITGWRRFSIVGDPEHPFLKGVYVPWLGRQLQAECLHFALHDSGRHEEGYQKPTQRQLRCLEHLRAPSDEDAPPHNKGFSCGIYLIPERECLQKAVGSFPSMVVDAECSAWGVAAEYELGWRTEFCRIDRIILAYRRLSQTWQNELDELCRGLRERYHVPVEVEGMTEEAAA